MSHALELAESIESLEYASRRELLDMAAELRRQHAEIEALRKDAERYRWLRDNHQYLDSAFLIVNYVDGRLWDDETDKAMEQAQ